MVNEERTFSRDGDLKYSQYHRKLGNGYNMMNVDCVEWRSGRGIVAFIETAFYEKKEISELLETKKWEAKVLFELQQKTGAPAYIVFHTENLSLFWIYKIENEQPVWYKTLPKYDYGQFIKNL